MNKIKPFNEWDFDDFINSAQDEYVCKISAEDFYNELETNGMFNDFASDIDLTGQLQDINMFGTITSYIIVGGTEDDPEEQKVFMEFTLTMYDCKLIITKTEGR